MEKIKINTILSIDYELIDKVTTIMEDAGWTCTGSHQAYKVNGVLKQSIHFEQYFSASNVF